MKNKAKFLIKQSLKKKMDTKWFKVVNVLLLVLMVAVSNIDKIIGFFGGDFKEEQMIYVVDNTNNYEAFSEVFDNVSSSISGMNNYKLELATTSVDELKKNITEENNNIIVTMNVSPEEYMVASVISYNPLDIITEQVISTSLSSIKSSYALANSGIDPVELAKISAPISLDKETVNPETDENSKAKDIMSGGILVIFLIPFFILITLLVQMIGAEINDEKTTRSMEIIISNVSPKVHFFSKIIASTGFVLVQAALIFIYGLAGMASRMIFSGGITLDTGSNTGSQIMGIFNTLKDSGMLSVLIKALPLLIIIFVLSFLAYALLAGILASMTTSIEDYQQLQTPLMLILMAGYYVGIMASLFDGSIFIKVISYVPFISALVAPITYALGQTTMIDLGISGGLLLLVCYLLFKYGIRVYKVGILNYSSKDLWKKVFKSLNNKEV